MSREDFDNDNVIWHVPILKAEKRILKGVVLVPNVLDAHEDKIKSEVIEEAAAKFLNDYNKRTKLGVQHNIFGKNIQLRQSYIAEVDFKLGKEKIKKGSWVLVVKVLDDDVWERVKKGKITGFSIGGKAKAKKVA